MRSVSIFGATGSVGCNTIDLLERQGGANEFNVVAITGGRNIAVLAAQARAMRADIAVTAYEDLRADLTAALAGTGIEIGAGRAALLDAADRKVDWSMSAIVGAAGLEPTVRLARHGTVLALANKESLVCAGPYLQSVCAKHGTQLLPVDSEHSALFQAINGEATRAVSRIILTASGGPFRTWDMATIRNATLKQALKHPNWEMGARITIDSATMFNKALEVIEAKLLFNVAPEQVEVIIHPQSIIHSMVGFVDGAILAQLGAPDMRGPIGYALNYPNRAPLPVESLDFAALARLDFEAPDLERFPALRLAWEALEIGGGAGAVLNGAKEIGLDLFLEEKIAFTDMAEIVEKVLHNLASEAASLLPSDGLDPILLLNDRARGMATALFESRLVA